MEQVENKSINNQGVLLNEDFICLGSKHKGEYLLKDDILFIEAYQNYSWLHIINKTKKLSCKPIGYYEKKMMADGFKRIHRSYLINLSYLKFHEHKYRLVHLKGEFILPVSHRKNSLFSKYLESA